MTLHRLFSNMPQPSAPHFHPTDVEEFGDFSRTMSRMLSNPAVRASGVFKLTPPAKWAKKPMSAADYDAVRYPIVNPMRQHVAGARGTYALHLVDVSTISSRALALMSPVSPVPYGGALGFDAVSAHFWRSLRFSEAPVYGADQRGSLLDGMGCGEWNLQFLDTPLQALPCEIAGVSSPMLYFGTYGSMFAWHTEDVDLAAVNYLHAGEPKIWYVVPPSAHDQLIRAFRAAFPSEYRDCAHAHRHKQFFLSPAALAASGVPFTRIVQMPGEFVVVAPRTFHAGFNCGFNIAESVNFMPPGDAWFKTQAKASTAASQCLCSTDNVHFQVAKLRVAAHRTLRTACAEFAAAPLVPSAVAGEALVPISDAVVAGSDGDDLTIAVGGHVDVFAAGRWWVARVRALRSESGSAALGSAESSSHARVLARVRLLGALRDDGAVSGVASASAATAASAADEPFGDRWLTLLPAGGDDAQSCTHAHIREHASMMLDSDAESDSESEDSLSSSKGKASSSSSSSSSSASTSPSRSLGGGSRSMATSSPRTPQRRKRVATPTKKAEAEAAAALLAAAKKKKKKKLRHRAKPAGGGGSDRAPKRRKRRAALSKKSDSVRASLGAVVKPSSATTVVAAQACALERMRTQSSKKSAAKAKAKARQPRRSSVPKVLPPPTLGAAVVAKQQKEKEKEKPQVKPQRRRPRREWVCSVCTLHNAGALSSCGACGGAKRYCSS